MKTAVALCLLLCISCAAQAQDTYRLWHALTLDFAGPESTEMGSPNPFMDFRLEVEFRHRNGSYRVRGFYAADGNAADTGADSGNVWRARFSPPHAGAWRWRAKFLSGPGVALSKTGYSLPLDVSGGQFTVLAAEADPVDFRGRGKLISDGQYLRLGEDGEILLKGGANSPENLLGYVDFDGTRRVQKQTREGENASGSALHEYAAHRGDWREGDPLWGEGESAGRGKGLIGAVNYLADMGMNSIYFLTMNVKGDGQDVWPWVAPEAFSRFDVSKLAQWERVFDHMQSRGIMLHVVTQETENEKLLSGGNTGDARRLYYYELIARFAHHPALLWNLGEENGPVEFSPDGQSTEQQLAMAEFFAEHDPYDHPVLIHTHSTIPWREDILAPLLGSPAIDGLSFQVDQREQVNAEVQRWRQRSMAAGQPWLITMDEIGMWHTGAKIDADDPTHDTLRQHALWGALMAGAAGVEWYFGGEQPHNDLTSEDWRQRESLWRQTRVALDFFQNEVPFSRMSPAPELKSEGVLYAMRETGVAYLYYLADAAGLSTLSLNDLPASSALSVSWFDPLRGGQLRDAEYTLAGEHSINIVPDERLKQGGDAVLLIRVSNP